MLSKIVEADSENVEVVERTLKFLEKFQSKESVPEVASFIMRTLPRVNIWRHPSTFNNLTKAYE